MRKQGSSSGLGIELGKLSQFDDDNENGGGSSSEEEGEEESPAPVMDLFAGNFDPTFADFASFQNEDTINNFVENAPDIDQIFGEKEDADDDPFNDDEDPFKEDGDSRTQAAEILASVKINAEEDAGATAEAAESESTVDDQKSATTAQEEAEPPMAVDTESDALDKSVEVEPSQNPQSPSADTSELATEPQNQQDEPPPSTSEPAIAEESRNASVEEENKS